MDIGTRGAGVTFAVHEVEAIRTPLTTWKTEHGINILLESSDSVKTIPIESCSEYNSNSIAGVSCNPLLAAVHIAFSEHRPLTLSPDIIWIAIMHGAAQHIKNNAEELRHLLVSHKDKISIVVTRTDILTGTPENAWDSVIHQFSHAVHSHVNPQFANLISDFSTTGELERTVCEVALLDMYQPYFEYEMRCICGIPEITLEGEADDWLKLCQKVELLAPLKLDWWLPHLREISSHFHRASKGEAYRPHWENIYKIRQAYGFARINGWIAKLFPYVKCGTTGKYIVRNPLLEPDADDWSDSPAANEAFFGGTGITTEIVPVGLACAPFKMATQEGRNLNMQFLGGFTGVKQDPLTFAVRPRLGWAVRQAPDENSLASLLPGGAEMIPPMPADQLKQVVQKIQTSLRGFGEAVPKEIVDFYGQCDGIRLSNGASFGFLPASSLSVVPALAKTREYMPVPFGRKQNWLRFFDNGDGTFFAVALNGPPLVARIESSGFGEEVAPSFNQFLTLIFANRGCLPPPPP